LRPRTDGAADLLVFFFVYRTCRLFCVLRVLAVFGLNATLIFSLIVIIIIIIIMIVCMAGIDTERSDTEQCCWNLLHPGQWSRPVNRRLIGRICLQETS